MPRLRRGSSNTGRSTSVATRSRLIRVQETVEERERRIRENRERQNLIRENETEGERDMRNTENRERMSVVRGNETEEETALRLTNSRMNITRRRNLTWTGKEKSAFRYNPEIDYESDRSVQIGPMSSICDKCYAKKWKDESSGLCCSNGKVKLESLPSPPEPLKSLLFDSLPECASFRKLIRLYNSVFQMTSFGGKVLTENGFNPTYKVQGQVYHRIGSLIPASGVDPQFLQIYFMGNSAEELQARLGINGGNLSPDIVSRLQSMLHEYNPYVRELKAAVGSNVGSSDYQVVIHADRKPAGAHPGVCKAPTGLMKSLLYWSTNN
uniref:Helitron helicase-like domain-containing protein n=1 Tax=Cacopsylla melanoneura TaxID=428564 RepID=A0A8D9B6V4_9HEMI